MASERRTSMATLIREAMEDRAAEHRRKPRSLGIGSSGHSDTARRIGEERIEPPPWRTQRRIDRDEVKQRSLAALGRFHSGVPDLASDHDRYLEEAFSE